MENFILDVADSSGIFAAGSSSYRATTSFRNGDWVGGLINTAGLGLALLGARGVNAKVSFNYAGTGMEGLRNFGTRLANQIFEPVSFRQLQGGHVSLFGGPSKLEGLSQTQRSALTQAKLEANAYRRLQEMQASTPGAHFLQKHGAQLTLQSQFDRVALGVNPTTGVVEEFIPSSATRFLSHRDQLNAIKRAEHIFATTGDPVLAQVPLQFKHLVGSGYQRTTLDYGVSYSAQVYLNAAGKAKTAFSIWGE